MKHMRYRARTAAPWLVAVMVLAAACSPASSGGATSNDTPLPLHTLIDIVVKPADPGLWDQTLRMDYESIDPSSRRLFVAYLGAGEVIAIDLESNVVTGHVTGLRRVHGVLVVPAL